MVLFSKRALSRLLALALALTAARLFAGDSDFSEIEALLQGHSEAWNQGDAEAWGEPYAEDAAFINIFGTRFPNREAMIARHADLFAGVFQGTSLELKVIHLHALAENVVCAETLLTVTGFEALPGRMVQTTPGGLTTRMTFILKQDDAGAWQIVFAQNTAVTAS